MAIPTGQSKLGSRIREWGSAEELHRVFEVLERLFQDEDLHPALNARSPEELAREVDLSIPDEGRPVRELYALAEKAVLLTPRTCTRRFFNQLFGGRILPAVAAEMLVSALNSSMYTYKVGGIQVLIEQEVLQLMCDYAGFAEGEGTFTPGGSISNLVAMIVARNEANPKILDRGFDGRVYRIYTSDQSHYSIPKNANFIGIGRDNVCKIESDATGRMRPNRLKHQIEADLQAGYIPFFINATSGTTVLGSFDPLEEIGEISRRYGIWFHVDAVLGGALLLNPDSRDKLKGCERADSLSWNAHKMMGVPLTASVVLLNRRGLLSRHFEQSAEYLFQSETRALNPGKISIQCGRRNDAFKVWMAFQYFGRRGYAQRVKRQLELARFAAEEIRREPRFRLVLEPESINVCFQAAGKSSEEICRRLDRDGLAKVGFGKFRGQSFIRLVCVDPRMSRQDIRSFLDDVRMVAELV